LLELPHTLRGLAGSPGVAVGTALVVGDLHAIFARRHVHSAQFPSELARVKEAVAKAQESLREVGARLAQEQTPILDAYVLMLADPMLHERIERHIREEKKCAEWAVVSAAEEIAKLFPTDADAYIVERRHDVAFHRALGSGRRVERRDQAGRERASEGGGDTRAGDQRSHVLRHPVARQAGKAVGKEKRDARQTRALGF